ncbi:MAG: NAD(P)-dependent oxidoreductase, partial [Rhodospirillaceae bacterium]
MEEKRAAFVGLGVMGFPMAGHLARQGWEVNVYNRSGYKASNWVDLHKGRSFSSPRAASQHCEFVFTCVGNDDDLRSVVYGDEGVLAGLNKGATLIDHTTTSASVAREVSEVADGNGIAFLDAPVSGGQAGAENGVLTIMVGGKKEAFETAFPA